MHTTPRGLPLAPFCRSAAFLFLLCGLIAAPAYADKITIPYAAPIKIRSVDLWVKCLSDPAMNGCVKLSSGGIPVSESDFTPSGRSRTYSLQAPQSGSLAGEAAPQAPLGSFEDALITGATDFLVARAKQEAQLYLQEQLTENLCKGDNLKLFPQTCGVLKQLEGGVYSMSGASTILRTAIRDDLTNYPEYRYAGATGDKDIKRWLYARLAVAIYREARGNRDGSEIIGGLAEISGEAQAICGTASQYPVCSKVLDSISEKAKVYWTLNENLRALREHLEKANSYNAGNRALALRYAITSTITDPGLKTAFPQDDRNKKIARTLSGVVGVLDIIQNYRRQIETLQTQDGSAASKQANLALRLRTTLNGVNALYQIATAFCDNPGQCAENENSLNKFQDATGLAEAVFNKDYSRIILEATAFAQDTQDSATPGKYLPLMVELASAQTSADMQKIFEAAAAPAGSYREKFNSDTLTSITAYAGAAYTNEKYDLGGPGTSWTNTKWQPFMPVGVQYTANWKNCGPRDNSFDCGVWGAFVSVIDVGALAMNRPSNGAVSSNSNTGFAQVFSPGLYLTWNPPHPGLLAMGIGIARTPKLVTANTGAQVATTRLQVFFALDLTLFAFR